MHVREGMYVVQMRVIVWKEWADAKYKNRMRGKVEK